MNHFHDRLDEFIPPDWATLGEWLAFARDAWADCPGVTAHLEDLANRHGSFYQVEFTTVNFFKYLNSIAFGYAADEAKWDFWKGTA